VSRRQGLQSLGAARSALVEGQAAADLLGGAAASMLRWALWKRRLPRSTVLARRAQQPVVQE